MAETQQRLFKSLFVSNPWLFYSVSFSPFSLYKSFSFLTKSLCVCRACSCLSSHLSLPTPIFPVHHINLALGRIQKFWGKQVCSGSRMSGLGLLLSEFSVSPLSQSLSLFISLSLVRENQRRSAPSHPCLIGVWLQRKQSEELRWGAYSSVRSSSEDNAENIGIM